MSLYHCIIARIKKSLSPDGQDEMADRYIFVKNDDLCNNINNTNNKSLGSNSPTESDLN